LPGRVRRRTPSILPCVEGRGPTASLVRDLVFAAIYVVQGTVYGFVTFVLIPTLSARGVSLDAQTGILALAGAPWVLKLLWAPLVDGVDAQGRRRRGPRVFVAVGLVGVALGLAVLAATRPLDRGVAFIAVLWLSINVLLALADVAIDALALDTVSPTERGRTQGFMLGGHHVGLEGVGGLALGAIVAATNLSVALGLQAILALVVAGAVWIVRVPTGAPPRRERRAFHELVLELVRRPGMRVALVVAALVLFADILTSAVSGHFWVQRLGWTPQMVAQKLPPVLLVSSVAGYLGASAVADRLGHRWAATLGSAVLGALWVSFALLEPLWQIEAFLLPFVAVQAVVTALMYVGLHAVFMGVVDPRARATHFVVFTVLLNLPRVFAPAVGSWTVDAWGFAGVFAACGLYQVAMAGLIARCRPKP
jgi:MFS transporter, PAT family, beta-lactamase induction signal transducer AmpG